MLFKQALLSISSLRKFDDEANKFYDRKHDLYEAALLTICYSQHALRLILILKLTNFENTESPIICYKYNKPIRNTRVLQKVLSLGSDYFSATFYQTYFYYKPSKYSPLMVQSHGHLR